jgi:hypothetical protein
MDTHVDSVTLNMDGSMVIRLLNQMNPAMAASFVGASSVVAITNPNPTDLVVTVTLTPASPIATSTMGVDLGGSESAG